MTALAPAQQFAPSVLEEPLAGNYFISVYPPFSAWTQDQVPALKRKLSEHFPKQPLGLYVHIPFCQKKCDYCYYLSYIGKPAQIINRYLTAVVSELQLYAQHPAIQQRLISFVYFGGGTPSILTEAQLQFLFEGLKNVIGWNKVEEVTFECAPRSVRPDFLKALRRLGVTRISMGVQSFDNDILKRNGRIHLVEDVLRAYAMIRKAGFRYVNLDLMCGLIGETPAHWHETIRQAIKLGAESITLYQTEVPYNTQLYRDLKSGAVAGGASNWNTKRARLLYGFSELEHAGYTVVSAYNAVMKRQLHRFKYQEYLWGGADMLGLGVASFGYINGMHLQNHTTLENYLAAVESGNLPVHRAYALSDWEQLVRELILQLKFCEVNIRRLAEKFGVEVTDVFSTVISELEREGFLVRSNGDLRLTRAGLLRVDRLLPRFYDRKFRDVRYT